LIQRDNKIAWFVLNKTEMETKLKDAKKALKDEKIKAKQALEHEKNKAKQFQIELAKTLKENGVSTEVIRQKTNLTIEEIKKL
jgi:nucleoid-associated protein YgaU